jgi:hypothetical protein
MLSPALLSIRLHGLYQDKALELPGILNLRHISLTGCHLNHEAIHKLFENCPYLQSFAYTQPAIYRFRKGTHITAAQITQALHSSRDSLERISLESLAIMIMIFLMTIILLGSMMSIWPPRMLALSSTLVHSQAYPLISTLDHTQASPL